jgi:hypothetical protein
VWPAHLQPVGPELLVPHLLRAVLLALLAGCHLGLQIVNNLPQLSRALACGGSLRVQLLLQWGKA